MSDVIHLLRGQPAYWCPVCKTPHRINTDLDESKVAWSWNGDRVKPTFGPASPGARFSILFYSDRGGHKTWKLVREGKISQASFIDKDSAETTAKLAGLDMKIWSAREVEVPKKTHVYCHTYVRAGMIKILPDSESLGGHELPLQQWDPAKWE